MLTKRAIHHLHGALHLLAGWPRWKKIERKIYCCLTIDLDAHGHSNAFQKGVPFLFDLLTKNGLEGATTWFYNCREKELAGRPSILREIQGRKEELALHCHLEDLPMNMSPDAIRAKILTDKTQLENLAGHEIEGFRSGRLLRTPQILEAMHGCGLTYDSSFTYGRRFSVNGRKMDDRWVSGNDSVIRLQNGLLEFPIWEPFPQPHHISLTGPPYFITNLVHPFNFVWHGHSNRVIQNYYSTLIHILKEIPSVEFTTLSQACQIWNQSPSRQS